MSLAVSDVLVLICSDVRFVKTCVLWYCMYYLDHSLWDWYYSQAFFAEKLYYSPIGSKACKVSPKRSLLGLFNCVWEWDLLMLCSTMSENPLLDSLG